jgi:DNA topoisomerase IA
MMPAQNRLLNAHIRAGSTLGNPYPLELRAALPLPYFDGWRRVLPASEAETSTLPIFAEGSTLRMAEVVIEAVTGEPPRRFTHATLVAALVAAGLSVEQAVSALTGMLTAEYLSGNEPLALTEDGRVLADYLTSTFADLTSPACAADLRAEISGIASGERERLAVLRAFWSRFGEALRPAFAPSVTSGSAFAHTPIVLRPIEGA